MTATAFDPVKYKQTTREQWQVAAEAWHRWGPTLEQWLGPATEIMVDMAGVRAGSRVLDVAAGAGGQTLMAARRVGPSGYVLATDIASNLLVFAVEAARQTGLTNVETRVMDGENLELDAEAFDAVISRVGLIYFPDQQRALTGMRQVLKPGAKMVAIVYSTAENNKFFSFPSRSFVGVSNCRRRCRASPARSASAVLACWRRRSHARGSAMYRRALSPRRCVCPRQPSASASSASRSGRCTRCWLG
jgi:SAM-dependent methyltransferase